MTDRQKIFLACVLCFLCGFFTRVFTHKCPVPEATVETKIQYKDKVKTEIAYVPKETTTTKQENTDLDVNIGKQELNVKLNGKDFKINKSTDEDYLFDKNKVTLNQTSQAAPFLLAPIPISHFRVLSTTGTLIFRSACDV